MQLNVHNKLALEWIQIVYILHMYDTIDMSNIVIHQSQSDYHPTIHDNVMVDLFPKITNIDLISY